MKHLTSLLLTASCLTAFGQLPDYVSTDGLVGWWPFEGSLENIGANGDEGLAYDGGEGIGYGTTYGSDRFSNPETALQIGYGAFAYLGLDFALELTPTDTLTIAFWSQPDPNGTVALTKYQNGTWQNSSWFVVNEWSAGIRAFGNGFDGTPNEGQWYSMCPNTTDGWAHAVVVFRGESTSLWVNGTFICEAINPVSSQAQTQPVLVGRSNCPNETNCNYSSGQFDDLGIWSRALDDAEILALFGATNTEGCTEAAACNYNPDAEIDDGTCVPCEIATGFCGQGTTWDADAQQCIVANPADINLDGCVQLGDLLDLLSAYGDCGTEESEWQCGNPLEYQGYDYETVQIGEQCWFSENLRSLSYQNGDIIPSNLNDNDWINATSGATAVYGEGASSCDDDSPAGNACDETWMLNFSGRLYNGYAVLDNRQLCPSGWQVPSQSDFVELGNSLGGSENAGNELKSSFGWYLNGNGPNSVGFDGRPGGFRVHSNGRFQNGGSGGWFWSASLDSNELMEGVALTWVSEELDINSPSPPVTGRSVRCIKE